jgi:UPF0755 protein
VLKTVLVLLAYILSIPLLAGCSAESMLGAYLSANQEKLEQPASAQSRPVQFVIEPGTAARTIAENLQAAGLIEDARLFEAYVRMNGLANRLEAGEFVLSPDMTPVEIAEALQHSRADGVAVTLREGWRLEQVADYLSATGVLDGDEYRRMAAAGDVAAFADPGRYAFLSARPAAASLEGYLFPDTYELPAEGVTAADLLQRQLDNFAAQVLPVYTQAISDTGGTGEIPDLHRVVTLASIVEREAVHADERPAIASVYLNRLAQNIRLEADPTVQYAMGFQEATGQWWKTPVTLDEYAGVDSPYNTYLYEGLPPGPIASPGMSSIRAVLQPAENDYLFFVAEPNGTGRHVFARTFEEHQQNVQKYLGQ